MPRPAIAIVRDNLSESAAARVRNMIVEGRLPAGERINEVHLSEELGVSRTPLREALARLAQEGALKSVARIGYFVRPLTLEEFEEIYAIRPLLDPEALRMAGVPSAARLARLREINTRLEKAKTADSAISLDDEWHLELIAACPNSVLLDLIRQFIIRTRRYEIALMKEKRNVDIATDTHKEIMTALESGNMDKACKALKRNMLDGREPIVSWLKSRDETKAER